MQNADTEIPRLLFAYPWSFDCDLDDDLMHRLVAACGDAGRVRILREEYHEAAAAYGQLYGLALTGQRAQILADGSDLAVPNVDFEGVPLGVHSIDEQHLNLPPCFGFNGRTARGRAKKRTFPQTEKFKKRKKETRSPPQKRLQTAFSVQHSFLTAFVRFSFSFAFVFIIFYHRNAKCVNAFCKIPV